MERLKRRCGDCGHVGFLKKDMAGILSVPHKEFPSVLITQSCLLWVCEKCNEVGLFSGDLKAEVIEASIREQTAIFLSVALKKTNMKATKLATLLGVTPQYLSMLRNGTKTPGYSIWNTLRMIAEDPSAMKKRLTPDFKRVAAELDDMRKSLDADYPLIEVAQ